MTLWWGQKSSGIGRNGVPGERLRPFGIGDHFTWDKWA
jgi:hypothetical protein